MKTIITLDDKKFSGDYCNIAHVEVVDEEGIHATKYVDVKWLVEALKGSRYVDDEYHRIGQLPQHYYEGAFRRENNGDISGQILLIVPKAKVNIKFEKTRYNVPFPTLLFNCFIENGLLERTQAFALKGKKWKKHTFLYNYPFGNVNRISHTVCWGNNALPRIENLQKLDVICSMFYDTPFNNDYYQAGKTVKWKLENLREVFEKLKNYEDFPEGILVKSGENIASLMKNFL